MSPMSEVSLSATRMSYCRPRQPLNHANYLLAAVKRAALTTTANAGGVEVTVPAQAPDPVASVVVLEMEPK